MKWFDKIVKLLVQNVPEELEICEQCREVDCTQERFEKCDRKISLAKKEDSMSCVCGHAEEEHGHDPEYPGSDACQAEGCDCLGFEETDEEVGSDDDEDDTDEEETTPDARSGG